MAYFGCGRKALFYKGLSEVERRDWIHPTRSVIPTPFSVIPSKEGIYPSVIARSEATRQSLLP